jgi:small subunit ribosomal protein S4
VFRLGIALHAMLPRQLVGHRHITVNGKVVNVPSYEVNKGDVISVRERSKSLEVIVNSLAGRAHVSPGSNGTRLP